MIATAIIVSGMMISAAITGEIVRDENLHVISFVILLIFIIDVLNQTKGEK